MGYTSQLTRKLQLTVAVVRHSGGLNLGQATYGALAVTTDTKGEMMEHLTYNMTFALVASGEEDFEVYCCHPDDDDVRLWNEEQIVDAEGHIFKIIKREN